MRAGRPGALAVLFWAALILCWSGDTVSATYVDNATADADFGTDVLEPPANLSAGSASLSQVTLNWTATPDTYATGYRIMRSDNGAAFAEVTTVTPASTTMYVDNVGSIGASTYDYYLVTYHGNWNSIATATIPCTKVVLALVCL